MNTSADSDPALNELVPIRELRSDPEIARIFPGPGSLDWELRQHRREYVDAGAIFELAGRLMARPSAFKKTALAIGARKLVARIQNERRG